MGKHLFIGGSADGKIIKVEMFDKLITGYAERNSKQEGKK